MKNLQGRKLRFLIAALMIAGLAFVGFESDKINNLAGPGADKQSDISITAFHKKNNYNSNGNEGNSLGNGGNGTKVNWVVSGYV